MVKILDCTLRDGGYYTHWDFDSLLVESYLKTMSILPIEYIEIGYRGIIQEQYEGEYYYLPISTLQKCKNFSGGKSLAVMINLKEINEETIVSSLSPCVGIIDLVRLAVRPQDILYATKISKIIKSMGFLVATNIMYMSTWKNIESFFVDLKNLEGNVDYVWMVDSYGAVLPNEISDLVKQVKSTLSCPIGFHGHNNLELAFANSLQAIQSGCELIDSTITGMGRGAGNLKTELLLVYLSKNGVAIDFYKLSHIVDVFEKMQVDYGWGTNIPYMISGVNSLPQKDIMEMMSKRRYSVPSIVEILQNSVVKNQVSYQAWNFNFQDNVILIGGGVSVNKHAQVIVDLVKKLDMSVVFTSAKHLELIESLDKSDCCVCLVGQEGHRLDDYNTLFNENVKFVVNSKLNVETYVPVALKKQTYELPITQPDLPFLDSPLTMALQLVGVRNVFMVGFDGYQSRELDAYDLMQENQLIIDTYKGNLISLLPTLYKNIKLRSIYSYE